MKALKSQQYPLWNSFTSDWYFISEIHYFEGCVSKNIIYLTHKLKYSSKNRQRIIIFPGSLKS